MMTLAQFLLGAQNRFVLGDAIANFRQLFQDFVDRETGQTMQLQFENGVSLHRIERPRDGRGNDALQHQRLA